MYYPITNHHNISNLNLKKLMKTEKKDPHSNADLTQKKTLHGCPSHQDSF